MRTSLKIARSLQLVGCVFLIAAIVSCSSGGLDGSGFVGGSVLVGLVLILGARIYEWLTKE